ncbi:MAG: hypothetical protein ACKVSF_01240, partial [Alphaproteobacteria bacterium]
MAALLFSGFTTLMYDDGVTSGSISIVRELIQRGASSLAAATRARGEDGFIATAIAVLRGAPSLRRAWRAAYSEPASSSDDAAVEEFAAAAQRQAPDTPPVAGRIVYTNAGLAAGGAERQIVNALLGLVRHGHTDVHFIGEHLGKARGLDFFAPALRELGIT